MTLSAASGSMQSAAAPLRLAKYSFGVGDRFARQGKAQLRACMLAANDGVDVIPVWNKSNREHLIVGSQLGDVPSEPAPAVACRLQDRRQTGPAATWTCWPPAKKPSRAT